MVPVRLISACCSPAPDTDACFGESVLGTARGFIAVACFVFVESVFTSFIAIPLIPFSQKEAQILLGSAFLSLLRVCVLMLLVATVRESMRLKTESFTVMEKFPRVVALSAPGAGALLVVYYAVLAVANPWREELHEDATLLFSVLAALEGCMFVPLHISVRLLLRKKKLETITLFRVTITRLEELEDQCCSVCLAELRAGDLVSELPCGHVFHAPCINEWLKVRPRCPMRCPRLVFPLPEDVVSCSFLLSVYLEATRTGGRGRGRSIACSSRCRCSRGRAAARGAKGGSSTAALRAPARAGA
eukprot:TRINITY_DN14943_c0_g1_i2.p1 TRINITY_DN14943_c0_g1~~TRINITY_DN14943_c0_g1_i2.p1  ORF type:complete len:303 (+),score=43.57 TRINITY_DN14943_c0_g1_i2:108-1016(+)